MSSFTSYDLAGPDPNPMTVGEVDALKELLPFISPIIIQIGAERGCSTLAMLEASSKAFIFSIDVGERLEEKHNLEKAGLDTSRVVRGLGRSQAIGEYWPSLWKADFVYIDGDHRYDGIYNDILLWSQAAHPDGILALHDYIHPDDRAPHIVGRVWEAVRDHREGLLKDWDQIMQVERLIAFRTPKNESNFGLVDNVAMIELANDDVIALV